ncbi:MAG: sulfotransferase [Candidatus Sedimenticola sp. 6PFRAG5]
MNKETHVVPNAIIAGTVKSGTTSVYTYLAQHPGVCNSTVKETTFFMPETEVRKVKNLEDYRNQFKNCANEKVIFEATPGYFFFPDYVIPRIKDVCEDSKIVLIFRDPAARFISFYKYKRAQLEIPKEITASEYLDMCLQDAPIGEFSEHSYLRGLQGGAYSQFFEPWAKAFKDRLWIGYFEDLKNDPLKFMNSLCEGLELPGFEEGQIAFEIENQSVEPKYRSLQRLALKTNDWLEPLSRSFPVIKRGLRKVYYAVNKKPGRLQGLEDVTARLRDIYEPENTHFRSLLQEHGFDGPFPPWLSQD